MKVISLINLKGGVAKSVSAINIAHILAHAHGRRVLLIDNDEQASTSRFFGVYDPSAPSIAEALTSGLPGVLLSCAKRTAYENLDVLPANEGLLKANKDILLDEERPQQTRLKDMLRPTGPASRRYDFVIVDNAPNLNMSTFNAIVAADDIIIPVKIDNFALDGLRRLRETIEDARGFKRSPIRIAGCLVTMYQKNNVQQIGREYLKDRTGLPLFETAIRQTVKVAESTFRGVPLLAYSRNCTAARDYLALVDEYLVGAEGRKLENVTENSTIGGLKNDL